MNTAVPWQRAPLAWRPSNAIPFPLCQRQPALRVVGPDSHLHTRKELHHTRTRVQRQKASSLTSPYLLVEDPTDQASTTATSYSVTPTAYNVLSAGEGFVAVDLQLYFADTGHRIQIGGVRVRLGHHSLY